MASSPSSQTIRIGTRGSPLALKQAEEVRDGLIGAHGPGAGGAEIVVISVQGDRIQDKALREFGGKGLFTKEIEDALLAGAIDMAVHSMKDVPTVLPTGLEMTSILEREDPRDGFMASRYARFGDLPEGATLGTSSLRRQAQALNLRPDLNVVTFRGNIQTRMRKLEEGMVDATFLACAGLKRMGQAELITEAMAPETILPAVAQGAIGVETRRDDSATHAVLAALHHVPTAICVAAERAFLARLDGSCRTPIAALATLDGDTLRFRGQVLSPDGRVEYSTERSGLSETAAEMGTAAACETLEVLGPDFLASLV